MNEEGLTQKRDYKIFAKINSMNIFKALIGVGILVVAIFVSRTGRKTVSKICDFAMAQTGKRSAKKKQILELLAKKGKLRNAEVRKALGVSDRSVVRYMDDLEREGKIEQVGDAGRYVVYRLKN